MLSDKFPDKIADFQVECYFNRKKDQELVSDSKSKSNLKERAEKGSLLSSGVASPENQHSKKRKLLGSFNENKSKITDKSSCQLAKDKNVKLENQDSEVSRQTKNGSRDNLTKLSDSHLRLPDRKGEAFDSKAISSRSKGLLEEVSFRENASKITDKLSSQLVKDTKVKLENQVSEVSRWTKNGSRDSLTKLSDYRKKLPDSKGETFDAKAISSGSKGLLKGVNFHENASKITNKSSSQLAKDEKVKLDNQVSEISRRKDGSRDDLMKLSDRCQSDCKEEPLDAPFDAKAISSGSKGLSKGVSSRENAGKNTDKTNSQLVNDKEVKPDDKPFEVTRRPHADKKRWFKPLSLEERLKRADDQGTLVFLENLDPSYTSADVKDILRHALNEEVDSKMIERSAFSSPHNGQAFVIFKSKDAAKGALRKLDERCLMLPNGRPLVADVITPTLREPGKTVKFVGHLEIDNSRLRKAREEMKNAVSTSHCSQPNTIEYDLAMEWCMLEEKSNGWWNALHKKQAKEIEQLMSQLKCAHKE